MSEYVETYEVKVTELASLRRGREAANRFKERLASNKLVAVITRRHRCGSNCPGCLELATDIREYLEADE